MCRIYGGTLQWDAQRRRKVEAAGNFVYTARIQTLTLVFEFFTAMLEDPRFPLESIQDFDIFPPYRRHAFEIYGFHWGARIYSATAAGMVERATCSNDTSRCARSAMGCTRYAPPQWGSGGSCPR